MMVNMMLNTTNTHDTLISVIDRLRLPIIFLCISSSVMRSSFHDADDDARHGEGDGRDEEM